MSSTRTVDDPTPADTGAADTSPSNTGPVETGPAETGNDCPAISGMGLADLSPVAAASSPRSEPPDRDASAMIDALAAAAAAPSDTPRATASPADALGETSVHVAVPDDTEPEPPRIIRQAQAERASRQQAAGAKGRAIAAQSWRDFAAGVVLSGVAGGVLYGILTTF